MPAAAIEEEIGNLHAPDARQPHEALGRLRPPRQHAEAGERHGAGALGPDHRAGAGGQKPRRRTGPDQHRAIRQVQPADAIIAGWQVDRLAPPRRRDEQRLDGRALILGRGRRNAGLAGIERAAQAGEPVSDRPPGAASAASGRPASRQRAVRRFRRSESTARISGISPICFSQG